MRSHFLASISYMTAAYNSWWRWSRTPAWVWHTCSNCQPNCEMCCLNPEVKETLWSTIKSSHTDQFLMQSVGLQPHCLNSFSHWNNYMLWMPWIIFLICFSLFLLHPLFSVSLWRTLILSELELSCKYKTTFSHIIWRGALKWGCSACGSKETDFLFRF